MYKYTAIAVTIKQTSTTVMMIAIFYHACSCKQLASSYVGNISCGVPCGAQHDRKQD